MMKIVTTRMNKRCAPLNQTNTSYCVVEYAVTARELALHV